MKKTLLFISTLLLLGAGQAMAQQGSWSFTWDTSRSDGGEGFYHISSNEDTIQEATLNSLPWIYSGNTSVTAYTGSAGQYFGSAKNPVTHATLTTSYVNGLINVVTIEAKKKEGADVTIGVSVGGIVYRCTGEVTSQLTTDWATYTFVPYSPIPVVPASPMEGEICITMDQTSETTGPIYFHSMSIAYDGPGIDQPVIEAIDPELSFDVQEVIVEAGDDAPANYLTNPYNVSPIKYTSSDYNIAVISNSGIIYTTGNVGQCTVTASFAGDDHYLPATASYTLTVVAKPVIEAPSVDVPAGTYDKEIRVTIKSDNPLCKAIWYSTTAQDSIDLIYDPNIVTGNMAIIRISESCTLRCCAVDYNNVGCVATIPYEIVIPETLTAGINLPEGAYYSPEAYAYLPLNVPVTYRDASKGEPSVWSWIFEGTDVTSSAEQNPTVTYIQEGDYEVELAVSDAFGDVNRCSLSDIHAGGALSVWNFAPTEDLELKQIPLGWYGNYAGTNWLGMEAFAERFEAPLTKALIDGVNVYFADTYAEDKEAEITVSLCLPGADGMPDEVVATSSMKVADLLLGDAEAVPTFFAFDTPAEVEGEFFVAISGFPNEGYYDDVAILCLRRAKGQRNTAYHLLEDEDSNYNLLGTYTWYANDDDPLSMAIAPHMEYVNEGNPTHVNGVEQRCESAIRYDLFGRRLSSDVKPQGLFIIK